MVEQSETVFFLERLQPDWLPTRKKRLQYVLLDRVAWGLLAALVVGLVLGWLIGLVFGLDNPRTINLVAAAGLVIGPGFGLVSALYSGASDALAHKRYTLRQLAGRVASTLVAMMLIYLAGKLIFGRILGYGQATGIVVPFIALGLALPTGVLGVLAGRPSLHPRSIIMVERLRWSWSKALRSSLSGIGIGIGLVLELVLCLSALLTIPLVIVLDGGLDVVVHHPPVIKSLLNPIYGLINVLSDALSVTLVPALVLTPVLGAVLGLSGGLVGEELVDEEMNTRSLPSQGIRRSARIAIVIGMVGTLVGTLVCTPIISIVSIFQPDLGLFNELIGGSVHEVLLALFYGFSFGASLALSYGGYTCLSHLALRLILWRERAIPWRYVQFLDYAAERILLGKVGGGYIFIHRLLQEHFASLAPERP